MCATARKCIFFSALILTGRDVKVRNLNVSSQIMGSTGSRLAHWEKTTRQSAFLCFVKDCINRPTAGGLVQKDSPTDRSWYIVPLCRDCNTKTGQDLDIWDEAVLVRRSDMKASPAAPSVRPAVMPRFAPLSQ